MIDTVAVKYYIELPAEYLKNWYTYYEVPPDEWLQHERPKCCHHRRMFIDTVVSVYFSYYPANDQYPKPYLRIHVSSLPKVLFGNNIQMIMGPWDVKEAIRQINQFLRTTGLVPALDFGKGVLARLDLCWNHQVGEYVPDYIKSLFNLTYPNRKTMPFQSGGVLFRSKSVSTMWYDKQQCNGDDDAKGLLRQEIRMQGTSFISKRMGVPRPTLKDVEFDWIEEELTKDLKRLHLHEVQICSRDLALEILVNKYGYAHGTQLFGHLISLQSPPHSQMIGNSVKERTLRHWKKQIVDAGVALTMTEKLVLPGLSIAKRQQIAESTKNLSENCIEQDVSASELHKCHPVLGFLAPAGGNAATLG